MNMNVSIFVSGSGTNCENIIRYFSGSDVSFFSKAVNNQFFFLLYYQPY